jgi:molybdopterin synthase catalytic subunit
MKIKVLYFALLKDITGIQEESIETNCSNVQCLKEQLEKKWGQAFSSLIEGKKGIKVIFLINGEIKDEIKDGDEVALMPPPAGGDLIRGRIDILEEIRKFRESAPPEAGSLVVYVGFVKGKIEDHQVLELDYESYDDYTKKRFQEIERDIKAKYKDLVDIKIVHTIDNMKPGENVMLIMALGRGRQDSIEAVKETVELVKHTTGIWKLEKRDDGDFWVVAGNTRVKKGDV